MDAIELHDLASQCQQQIEFPGSYDEIRQWFDDYVVHRIDPDRDAEQYFDLFRDLVVIYLRVHFEMKMANIILTS